MSDTTDPRPEQAFDRYLPLDEEGYFLFDTRRVDDDSLGQTLIHNLRLDENARLMTSMSGQDAFVEAFDEPLIARHVRLNSANLSQGVIDLPYHLTATFEFSSLSVDEWDRFHGLAVAQKFQVPFVFSRQAQVEFFDLLDGFDDDSVTVKGQTFAVGPWLLPDAAPDTSDFWSEAYQKGDTRFDQGQEAAALPDTLAQLKLSRAKILVLGSGFGHDAAYFAKQGHTVTAIDFSAEAIERAKALYGTQENLTFQQMDMFQLPDAWTGAFDLVFEHACYCAVSPERRAEVVNVWRKVLHSQGYMLGIFFIMQKRQGPPWGGSEWELRQRLSKYFEFMFWTRWRHSKERRRGRELVVYARKR